MSYRAIPLLFIALLIYNLVVLLHPHTPPEDIFYGSATIDSAGKLVARSADLFSIKMPNSGPNGDAWHFTTGDLMLLLGFVLLAMEVVKSAYTRGAALADQALSTVLLVVFLVEFLLVSQAHTALFFLLTLMSAFDVIVGAIVGIRTARRGIGIDGPSQ